MATTPEFDPKGAALPRTTSFVRSILALAAAVTGLTAVAATPAGAVTRMSTKTMLAQLSVASVRSSGYDRSKFKLWIDADHDGCDTRREVLIAEAKTKPEVGAGCSFTGGRWISPYDSVTTTNAATLDIDHLVPLAEAWRSGAWKWNENTRMRYANDLGYGPDLEAVSAHANRSKGDDEPSSYLPPRRSFDCTYEAWWVAVKWRWHLSVDSAEKSWLTSHLRRCGWPRVNRPSRPAIGAAGTGGSGGSGSGSSTSGVKIVQIYFDSPGPDDHSNASLNAEWVQLENVAGSRKTITGWTLHDASTHQYTFPATALAAGATLRVHTGQGVNNAGNRYWASSGYIWNNSGDTALLRNSRRTVVARCAYTSAADPVTNC